MIATPGRTVDVLCNVAVLLSNRQAYICSKLVTLGVSYTAASVLSENVHTMQLAELLVITHKNNSVTRVLCQGGGGTGHEFDPAPLTPLTMV